jgi:exosortase
MVRFERQHLISLAIWVSIAALAILSFRHLFGQIFYSWWHNEEYAFGILIPPMVAYLTWVRRHRISSTLTSGWPPGLLLAAIGCSLQVLASRSGTLLLSGIALIMSIAGAYGYLWGKQRLALVTGPLALLILMVPLPSYAVGEVSWYLQSTASTVSGTILGLLGIPVHQDGNLLQLASYVLEVKQACSGSRSIFALLALACAMGLSVSGNYWSRISLVIIAPILAVGANVIRIVGTGLIASEWGSLAANESLHRAWGIAVFLIALSGLIGTQRLLRRISCKNA